MPLRSTPRAHRLEDVDEGVLFHMSAGEQTIGVFVSCQALEGIDPKPRGRGTIERFNEYRAQFEEIARDKYDKGHLERDGNLCIRGRDLPGSGH